MRQKDASFYYEALKQLKIGILITDIQHKIIFANNALFDILKIEIEYDLAGESLTDILANSKILKEYSFNFLKSELQEIVSGSRTSADIEFSILKFLSINKQILPSGDIMYTFDLISSEHSSSYKMEQVTKVAMLSLADLSEFKDPDTGEHVMRVARLTHEITRALIQSRCYPDTANETLLRHIGIASILHDIGKVSIPDKILLKPARLTPEERVIMQKHTMDGSIILSKASQALNDNEYFRIAAQIAQYHHEYWDGSGYPEQLTGEQIPLSARIVAVADVCDALAERRPYKEPWPIAKVKEYLNEYAGSQFDPKVVAAFNIVMRQREQAQSISWSDEMTVRNEKMDTDHKILLALINQMMIDENRHDHLAVIFVLDELINYTLSHFRKEEKFMQDIDFADTDRHKKLHENLFEQVKKMQNDITKNFSIELTDQLSSFLKRWLLNHIMIEDKKYSQGHQ